MNFKSKEEMNLNNFIKLLKSYLGRIDCPNLGLKELGEYTLLLEKDSVVLLLYNTGMVARIGEYDFMNNYKHFHEFEWLINEICRYFELIKPLEVKRISNDYSLLPNNQTVLTNNDSEFYFFSNDFEKNMKVLNSYIKAYL